MGKSEQAVVSEQGLRRIAIVLGSLPADVATTLIDTIDGDLKDQLEAAFQEASFANEVERQQVLQQFRKNVSTKSPSQPIVTSSSHGDIQDEFQIGLDLDETKKQNLQLNRQVASVVTQWDLPNSPANNESPFAFLDEVDDDMAVELLNDEHAQTIALVFASITPKQAARLLPRLDADTQAETIRRIEKLDDVSATLSKDVARHLQEKVERLQHDSVASPGHTALQAIKAALPHEFDKVFEPERSKHPTIPHREFVPLEDQAPALNTVADGINDESENEPESVSTIGLSPSADDFLCSLPPQTLCSSLGKVQTRVALLTLCGLPSVIADRTIALLPRHKAKKVRIGMRSLCSIQLREIDEAKALVAQVCAESQNHPAVPAAA